MTTETLPPFVQFLLRPESYAHPVDRVELVQTHISYVFLAGDFVYKFKKPVNFGFLDFSDLAKRQFYCEQELLLNRRLCPNIYLGLVQIQQERESFSLISSDNAQGAGAVIEYGIQMRRMPEERMMLNLIRTGTLKKSHIEALVAVLVPFYQHAAGGGDIDNFGKAEAVAVNVLENFDQTRAFIGHGALSQAQFDAISSYARGVLADTARFQKRIDAGRIRDCHGDLYSANICLAEKPYIYDCIEFNQRFRYCDVASDVAFLAMDLDYHGLEPLSTYFIERFVAVSGDTGLVDMLDFYKCYRAYVRGKIGLFTANDPGVDEAVRKQNLDNAARYFVLAAQYAAAAANL
ncbi:MAG: hypothetical protein ACOX4Z_06590 [Desulfobulbus sp.]|jgi:aminoglycoside phosphotransferase family enzyme|nr:hypothetical protein [Desulfobulbaceae bacterium]